MTHPDDWTSSSYSQNNGGECIQWAPKHAAATGAVRVRDSKSPGGPVMTLTPAAWAGLVTFAQTQG